MKIITAIGNQYLNEKLKENKQLEIIGKDIQYQDGILEILEYRQDIDIVILSNNLQQDYEFDILINKIQKIKKDIDIIVFLKDKNDNIENYLNSKQIYKIYYLDEIDYFINNFISNLKNSNLDINKQINDFKNLIFLSKDNISNKLNNDLKFEDIFYEKENCKIIAVSGYFGVGKSIISSIIANYLSLKNKKTLLIDFDIFNNSINTIFKNINNNFDIIPYNKNLNIFCGIEKKININNKAEIYKIKQILNDLKKEYDFLIIDTTSKIELEYIKLILNLADKILFLVEPNISEIKKSNSLLEIFIKDFEIENDKIKILFNKVNKYKIVQGILEDIFSDFEIIGNLEYEEKYNLIINSGFRNIVKREYEEIYKKIV